MLIRSESIAKGECVLATQPKFASADGDDLIFIGRGHQVIKDVIPELEAGRTVHFASKGHFHLHELVERIFFMTGPAKYYTTTWAISEAPMRKILELVDKGYITEINALFDFKTKAHAPKAFQLIEGITSRIVLTHIHAKVKVIENEKWCVSINSSANDTQNSRYEAGVITPNKIVSGAHRDWILEEIKNATKPGAN